MLLLRRRYSDSYLAEIGEPGTNGALVRRKHTSSLADGLLCRDYFYADNITFVADINITSVPSVAFTDYDEEGGYYKRLSWTTRQVGEEGRLTLTWRTGTFGFPDETYKGGDCSMPSQVLLRGAGYDGGDGTVWNYESDIFEEYAGSSGQHIRQRLYVRLQLGNLYSPCWGQMSGVWQDIPRDNWMAPSPGPAMSHEHYADCVPEGCWAIPFKAVVRTALFGVSVNYPGGQILNPSGNEVPHGGITRMDWRVVNQGYFVFSSTQTRHRVCRSAAGVRSRTFSMSREPGMPAGWAEAQAGFGEISAADQAAQAAVARNMYYDSFAPARFTTRSGDFHFAGRA